MFYVFIFFIFLASYLQFFSSCLRCFHLKSRTSPRCFLLLIEKSPSSNAREATHLSQSMFFSYSHWCFASISLYVLLLFTTPHCFVILWFPDSLLLAPCSPLTLDRPSSWQSPTLSHTILSPTCLCSITSSFLARRSCFYQVKVAADCVSCCFLVAEHWRVMTMRQYLPSLVSLSSSVSFQCAPPCSHVRVSCDSSQKSKHASHLLSDSPTVLFPCWCRQLFSYFRCWWILC